MVQKHRKSKKNNEGEIDSAAADLSETTGESTSFETNPQESVDSALEEQISASREDESPSEDLLDDVRRSLIEDEESDRRQKESKWWRRIGRKGKRTEPEPLVPPVEIDLPDASLQDDIAEEQIQSAEPDEYAQQIDDLVDLLAVEPQQSTFETSSVVEPEFDLEQLKEQAFRPRTSEEVQSEGDVRSIALEGGEGIFVEVETRAVDPFQERLKAFENALKPYRNYIYMTFTFLGVVLAVILSLLMFNAYQQSRPQPVKEVSNLPYPIAVSLPGGWSFNLGRGSLQAGKWEPSGAEWLDGTEVCRWVSLPWSRQLEAVLRTLNPNDPIELVMSNNDKLVYGVYSVYELTPEEIQKQDANSPCLLLILTGSDSEKRWVLTAVP